MRTRSIRTRGTRRRLKERPESQEVTGTRVRNHRLLRSVLHVVSGGAGSSLNQLFLRISGSNYSVIAIASYGALTKSLSDPMQVIIPIKIPRKVKPTCQRLKTWFLVKTILRAQKNRYKTPDTKAQNMQRQRHIGSSVNNRNGL